MPVDFHTFQTVAEQSWSRVVLERGDGEETLASASRVGFGRSVGNAAVRQAFAEALRTQFGAEIADSLNYRLNSTHNLSSREIRNVIQQAKDHAHSSNMNRVLCLFSQRCMSTGGLGHPRAVNPDSLLHILGHLLDKASPDGTLLSAASAEALADQLIGITRRAGEKPQGVELLNQERYSYNVEDRVKAGTLHEGDRLGPFEFVRLKQKGVEPGFEARMAWQPEHTRAMKTPGTRLHAQAITFLNCALEGKFLPPEGTKAHTSLRALTALGDAIRAKAQVFLQEQGIRAEDRNPMNALRDRPEDLNALRNALMEDSTITLELEGHVRQNDPFFTDIHYVKMDYAESDKTLASHKLRIPTRTAKGFFHREFTAKTRIEANHAALKETLATDLMRAMGIESQKARLVPASYADGSLKLMVEAEHMSMTGADGERLRFTDFAGNLRDGILTQPTQDGSDRISDPVVERWGRNKILFLLMADRDAIGSRGDNKGRMGDTFAAIDPGHSLEGFMRFRNIHSDFSFDQPGMKHMRFKNFSMFDDCSYSEKMQGIRQLVDMRDRGEDLRVFDSYVEWLNEELSTPRPSAEREEFQSMLDKVESMKAAFVERRDYILDEVFGERIRFMDAVPPVLDALDALEKLTSPTRMTSPSGEIRLRHPQLSGSRQEWHIAGDGQGGYTFSTTGGSRLQRRLTDFLQGRVEPLPELSMEGGVFSLHIPHAQLTDFLSVMTEQEVVAAKHEAR